MLLVSFLLWLCGIFCDLCTVTAFAPTYLTAAGGRHCCHMAGFCGKKVTVFLGVPPAGFFFSPYDTAFVFLPLQFLLLSLLATSVAAVYNSCWQKGNNSNCLCLPRRYSESFINILAHLDSFIIHFPQFKTNYSLSTLHGPKHNSSSSVQKNKTSSCQEEHQFPYLVMFLWLFGDKSSVSNMESTDSSLKDICMCSIPSRHLYSCNQNSDIHY